YDVGLLAAVVEELVYGVSQQTPRIQPSELTLEVRPALDERRLVRWSLGGPPHEGTDRRRHAGDRVDPARQFFDVDARICERRRHDWVSSDFVGDSGVLTGRAHQLLRATTTCTLASFVSALVKVSFF